MTELLTSIIIPTYNRAETLVRAIESVLQQSYTAYELIVVDDCSMDDTATVMERYSHDNRVTYIKLEKNIGGAAARNVGINKSKGSFIAFQDSDDEWLPEKLQKQMQVFFDNPQVDVVFSKIARITNGKISVFPHENITGSKNLHTKMLKSNYIGTPSAVIKKNKLNEIGGFDSALPRLQDWDLFIRLSSKGVFYMIDQVLCNAYLQEDSITKNSNALVKTIEIFNSKYKQDISALTKKDKSSVYEKYGSLLIGSGVVEESKVFLTKAIKENPLNLKLLLKYSLILFCGEKGYRMFK